jgi:putative Mn2+ efflux pump MntP
METRWYVFSGVVIVLESYDERDASVNVRGTSGTYDEPSGSVLERQAVLLLLAVVAVGVFHTAVPDHWVPIAILARSRKWSQLQTARAAALAGVGHTVSTLIIGVLVWVAGVAFAQRFGHVVSLVASAALVAFGLWFVVAGWREARAETPQAPPVDGDSALRGRTALLLILGSSPMIEGIPAFFAASRYGAPLLVTMSMLFALATIVTYVVLCVQSARALARMSFGRLERYGEAISGAVIALVGVASFFLL